MKKLFCLLFVIALCVLASSATFAQTTCVSEQKFQELFNEMRQLRLEVQRLSTSAQQVQLLLERTRIQQEHVFRLTQELNSVSAQLTGIRDRKEYAKDELAEAKKSEGKSAFAPNKIESLVSQLQYFNEREQVYAKRELQLASELELERATLNELKTRLDKLENEISTPTSEPAKKRE